MNIFLNLLEKILPLYLIIFLGYIAGKFLKVQKESIASLLIYILVPIIIFHGIVTTKLSVNVLSLPFVFCFICCFICLLFYRIGKLFWQDSTKNILAFASGGGNIGYFGLPVAVNIMGEKVVGIVALLVLGYVLYESTVGFFITARGHHTVRESIFKLIKLPAVYAFLFGILINISGMKFGQTYFDTITLLRGAYTILGMMLIGIGLSNIKGFSVDIKFVSISFIAKFLVWPLLVGFLIFFDNMYFHLYSPDIHKALTIISVVPIAANVVAFATILKTQPEKASITVLLSTVFALFYVPFIVAVFLK
jgi:malate permease and related proteins